MPNAQPTVDLETAARLRIAIGRISRRLRTTTAGAAAGLTPTKISVLLTVVRDGPMKLSELAESEALNPTMLSRAISHLVDLGLVARSNDDGDRRAAWVQATAAGIELAERLRRERTDAVNAALAQLSPGDRRVLERSVLALELLADALRGAER
jgi:DNA-binding MarR family transcriptional regulator